MDRGHLAVGKCGCVEPRRVLSVFVEPQADGVLGLHRDLLYWGNFISPGRFGPLWRSLDLSITRMKNRQVRRTPPDSRQPARQIFDRQTLTEVDRTINYQTIQHG
jgi:hypothetical protein